MKRVNEAKDALEDELVRPLYNACRQYVSAARTTRGNLGVHARAAMRQRIEIVLARHYARTVMAMTGRKPPKHPSIADAALSLRHANSLNARAHAQSLRIMHSLDRDMHAHSPAMRRTAGSMHLPDDGTGHTYKADPEWDDATAGYEFRFGADALERLRQRMETLVNIETQGVAEEGRWEYVQQENANARLMQEWTSRLDHRVRHPPRSKFDHLSPHGQRVPVDQPFIISGQRLRFPGDGSLGASLGNLINCRCNSRYFAIGPDGKETEIYITPHAPARRQRVRGERPARQGDNRPAYNPTSRVTLNGTTRARVILGNGEIATLRQERPDLILIRRGTQTIGRAQFSNGRITQLTVAPAYRDADVEGLLRRTIER